MEELYLSRRAPNKPPRTTPTMFNCVKVALGWFHISGQSGDKYQEGCFTWKMGFTRWRLPPMGTGSGTTRIGSSGQNRVKLPMKKTTWACESKHGATLAS